MSEKIPLDEKSILEVILIVWAAGACAFMLVTALCVVTHQLDWQQFLTLLGFLLCWSAAACVGIILNNRIRVRVRKKSEKADNTEEENGD